MKSSVLGLLIATAAFGASTIYLAVQLNEERKLAEQVDQKVAALNARIAELEKAGPPPPLDLEPPGIPEKSPAPARPGEPAASRPGAEERVAAAEERRPRVGSANEEPPESLRRVMRTQMRANTRRLYADLGDKLGLTKEQTNALIDLLTDQQVAGFEGARQARQLQPEEWRAQAQARQQANEAQISNLIGAGKMEEFRAYQETLPARQELEMLTRHIEGSGAAELSKGQRDQLVAALTEERQRVPAPQFADSQTREEFAMASSAWQSDYQERAARRVNGILDGEQLKAYDEYQQMAREMRQRSEARRAARQAEATSGPTSR